MMSLHDPRAGAALAATETREADGGAWRHHRAGARSWLVLIMLLAAMTTAANAERGGGASERREPGVDGRAAPAPAPAAVPSVPAAVPVVALPMSPSMSPPMLPATTAPDVGAEVVTIEPPTGGAGEGVVASSLTAAPLEGEQGGSGVPGEVTEYYAYDALGSIRMVFNPTGTVVGQASYTPFGQELSGTTGMPSQRFTGQERDHEMGLDYFGARHYQLRTGRFSSVDPVLSDDVLQDPQRWNRYSYALNNPLTFTDPTGLNAQACTQSGWYEMTEKGELGTFHPDGKNCNDQSGGGPSFSWTFSLYPGGDGGGGWDGGAYGGGRGRGGNLPPTAPPTPPLPPELPICERMPWLCLPPGPIPPTPPGPTEREKQVACGRDAGVNLEISLLSGGIASGLLSLAGINVNPYQAWLGTSELFAQSPNPFSQGSGASELGQQYYESQANSRPGQRAVELKGRNSFTRQTASRQARITSGANQVAKMTRMANLLKKATPLLAVAGYVRDMKSCGY